MARMKRIARMQNSLSSFRLIRVIRSIRAIRDQIFMIMKPRGYTFVEMMVVLAIIALMMAIIVPRFAMSQKGAGLKGAATELSTALRAARRLAITKREVRALALDIYSIPAQFTIMKWATMPEWPDDVFTWIQEGEARSLPENVAVVAVMTSASSWSALDIYRTDDVDLDGLENSFPLPPAPNSSGRRFNPQTNATTGLPHTTNDHVNPIYHLIKFQPTGTADRAVIYLWNIEDGRQEIPAPTTEKTIALGLSNILKLGVPPGLMIYDINNQQQFFRLPDAESPADSYYYTIVVNPITGGVVVYDYAYGEGSGSNSAWDRKKDG